jgi:uncharacterized protein YukE
MTSGKKPAPLPTSVAGGLGIDFQGLSQLAGVLYNYAPQGEEVVHNIDHSIKQIVQDARWKGTTAKAFTDAWEKTASEAGKLAKFEAEVGEILDQLAVRIAWISKNYDEKCSAYSHGEPIDIDKEFTDHIHQAEEAEKSAAEKLIALYIGKSGGWSLEGSLKTLASSGDISAKTRNDLKKELAKIRKNIDDQVPHESKSLLQDMGEDSGKWATVGMTTGGLVGTAVGALGFISGAGGLATVPAGTVSGAGIGGTLGGLGGAVYGAFDHFF